jgi:hypothetical protein
MIKSGRRTLAVLFVFLVAALSIPALEIQLEYKTEPKQPGEFQPNGYGQVNKMTDVPPGDWKLPSFTCKTPVYAMLKIGETERLIALDMKTASDNFYNRLYFDNNNNRDLTDDAAVDAEPSPYINPSYFFARFPGIDTTYSLKGKTLPYRFKIQANFSSPPNIKPEDRFSKENINQFFYMYYQSYGYYSGQFNLEGSNYYLYVCDANGNGVFNEAVSIPDLSQMQNDIPYPIYAMGDKIFISNNQKIGYLDEYDFPQKIMIKDKLYDISLHETELKLTINPCMETLYPVSFPMDLERSNIYRRDGKCGIGVFLSGKEIKIPKGEYICLSYSAIKKDEMGNSWRLQSGASKDTPWLTVDGSWVHKFQIGEPYAPVVNIPQWAMMNFKNSNSPVPQVQLYFNLEGAGKELVTSLDMISVAKSNIPLSTRYPNRPEEPRYVITRADGSITAEGRFEYG